MFRSTLLLLIGGLFGSLVHHEPLRRPQRYGSDVVRGWYEELDLRARSGELTRPLDDRPILVGHLLLAMAIRRGDERHACTLAESLPELTESEVLGLAGLLERQGQAERATEWLVRGIRENDHATDLVAELARLDPSRGQTLVDELLVRSAEGRLHEFGALFAWSCGEIDAAIDHLVLWGRGDPRPVTIVPTAGGVAPSVVRADLAYLLRSWGLATLSSEAEEPPAGAWVRGHGLLRSGDRVGATREFLDYLAEGDEYLGVDDSFEWLALVPEAALAWARQVAIRNDEPDDWGQLGDVAWYLGRYEEADRAYERALEPDPLDGYWSVVRARVRLGLPPHDDREDWNVIDDLLEGPFGLESSD